MSSDISERLRNHTSTLVNKFTSRVSDLKRHPEFLNLVKELDKQEAGKDCIKLFSRGEYVAIGIDGSMDYDERLEMLLFYVCATAFKCPFVVNDNDININLNLAERDSKLSVSAAVPLWLEDLSDVSLSISATETDFDFTISLERIPYALMTLGELSIGINSLENRDVKVIFLDRPLSGTYGPASRDLRLLLRRGESSLTEFSTPFGKLSMLDISLASVLGPGNLYVPRRNPYIVYSAIQLLLRKGEMKKSELAKELNLDDKQLGKLMKKLDIMNERYEDRLIEKSDIVSIKLKDDVKNYWKRTIYVAEQVSKRIFQAKDHPLQIKDDKWLTVLDINAVNLFLIYHLMQRSFDSNVLVIGITKDTSASDFTRSILPLSINKGLVKPKDPYPNLKNDKAFLTIISAVNCESINTPWRTLAYDTCFTTLVKGKDQGSILRAARKYVSREKLFVKSYFQLRTFATDQLTRSPIFVYDRFYDERRDEGLTIEIDVMQREKVEGIKPIFEGSSLSSIDNLILFILSQSDNPEVLEAFGHNQLLYLADKAVKSEVKLMRGLLRGVADLQLGTLARKERIFSISRRFRDLRAESEMIRSRVAQEGRE